MTVSENTTIKEIVTNNFNTTEIFRKYNLDFCCSGNKTIAEACEEKNLNIDKLIKDLKNMESVPVNGINLKFNEWDIDFLTDFILNHHHTYVKKSLPLIHQYLGKVARVHGQNHPEMVKVFDIFTKMKSDLESHLMKEEQILFPYVKNLIKARNEGNKNVPGSCFGTIRNPISVMRFEHETAGDELNEIRELTNNFEIPAGACNTYLITLKKLEEFESDLFVHVHLENNILFPKAIELENEVLM